MGWSALSSTPLQPPSCSTCASELKHIQVPVPSLQIHLVAQHKNLSAHTSHTRELQQPQINDHLAHLLVGALCHLDVCHSRATPSVGGC